MKLIIDRFEGDIAICESDNGGHIDIPRELLPNEIREGDIIGEKDGMYFLMSEETKARRRRIRNMLRGLMKE